VLASVRRVLEAAAIGLAFGAPILAQDSPTEGVYLYRF